MTYVSNNSSAAEVVSFLTQSLADRMVYGWTISVVRNQECATQTEGQAAEETMGENQLSEDSDVIMDRPLSEEHSHG